MAEIGTRYYTEDLPPELLKQLTRRGGIGLDHLIVPEIEELEGTASTNELIVHLYHRTGRVYQRSAVQGALYRLTKAGRVEKLGESLWALTAREKSNG